MAKIMGELQGWKPGKENRPRSVSSTPNKQRSSPSKRRHSHHAAHLGEVVSPRRNPGRAARPDYLTDETSSPHTPDSGIGSLFYDSPGVCVCVNSLVPNSGFLMLIFMSVLYKKVIRLGCPTSKIFIRSLSISRV